MLYRLGIELHRKIACRNSKYYSSQGIPLHFFALSLKKNVSLKNRSKLEMKQKISDLFCLVFCCLLTDHHCQLLSIMALFYLNRLQKCQTEIRFATFCLEYRKKSLYHLNFRLGRITNMQMPHESTKVSFMTTFMLYIRH